MAIGCGLWTLPALGPAIGSDYPGSVGIAEPGFGERWGGDNPNFAPDITLLMRGVLVLSCRCDNPCGCVQVKAGARIAFHSRINSKRKRKCQIETHVQFHETKPYTEGAITLETALHRPTLHPSLWTLLWTLLEPPRTLLAPTKKPPQTHRGPDLSPD